MQDGSKKAIIAAFFANLGIAIAKFVGFAITGSAGLLAEAGHSFADTGNQALLLLGSKRGKRVADTTHPFGYGPERYFWAFVVALVLFSMGGLFAIYEGISKVRHPHELDNAAVAVGILLFAIALETFSLTTAVRESNHIRDRSKSWWHFIRTTKSPELPVVLLEDMGAEIGLLFALSGIGLAHVTGDPRWDAVGSIAIGILLVVIAIVVAIEMKALLIGESPSDADQAAICNALVTPNGINGVIHMRAMHLGPEELLIAAKLDVDPSLDIAQLAAAIDQAEAALRSSISAKAMVYIEPDIRRDTTPQ